jgi:hypothetical protein
VLDVRRVLAGVVRRALPELDAVGQVHRAAVHVQRSPHLIIRQETRISSLIPVVETVLQIVTCTILGLLVTE